MAHMQRGRDAEAAVADLSHALELAPSDGAIQLALDKATQLVRSAKKQDQKLFSKMMQST